MSIVLENLVQPSTSKFLAKDVKERWYTMLCDPVVSMEVAIELAALNAPLSKSKQENSAVSL